ncbi:MAG: hypothetical protein O2780_17400 [Proteobacteria bacterium]|nr:hypothetical protein [Pseudomonadota bacterium]
MAAFTATTCFVVLLLAIYVIHARYFAVNVVLYAAIIDALIATGVAGLLLGMAVRSLNGFEKILLIIIWLLGGYSFAISVPAVLDRSLSFYILEKIQQRGGGILESEFEKVFTREYVKEHRLMDVRLTEQLESGTIEIVDGCVRLTRRGDVIATASRYFRREFLPQKRLLMGQYSDDLVDPFDESPQYTDYLCQ